MHGLDGRTVRWYHSMAKIRCRIRRLLPFLQVCQSILLADQLLVQSAVDLSRKQKSIQAPRKANKKLKKRNANTRRRITCTLAKSSNSDHAIDRKNHSICICVKGHIYLRRHKVLKYHKVDHFPLT